MLRSSTIFPYLFTMALIVVASNVLVNFPVGYSLGAVNLADILTWGAFTYPAAFLVTDLANRKFGPSKARKVVFVGFLLAVICSISVPQVLFSYGLFPFEMSADRLTRIAVASGTAFLTAQLLDIFVFNKLREMKWWKAPLISSLLGSAIDTCLFFGLAFSISAGFLGEGDGFALESAPFMAVFAAEAPRWISWACGDFAVKTIIGMLMLLPYRFAIGRSAPAPSLI